MTDVDIGEGACNGCPVASTSAVWHAQDVEIHQEKAALACRPSSPKCIFPDQVSHLFFRMSAFVDRGAERPLERLMLRDSIRAVCTLLFFGSRTRLWKEYVLSRRTWVACALFAPRQQSRPSS